MENSVTFQRITVIVTGTHQIMATHKAKHPFVDVEEDDLIFSGVRPLQGDEDTRWQHAYIMNQWWAIVRHNSPNRSTLLLNLEQDKAMLMSFITEEQAIQGVLEYYKEQGELVNEKTIRDGWFRAFNHVFSTKYAHQEVALLYEDHQPAQ